MRLTPPEAPTNPRTVVCDRRRSNLFPHEEIPLLTRATPSDVTGRLHPIHWPQGTETMLVLEAGSSHDRGSTADNQVERIFNGEKCFFLYFQVITPETTSYVIFRSGDRCGGPRCRQVRPGPAAIPGG